MCDMRESGIAWVGLMPAEWKIKRGKFVLKLLNRPIKETDDIITCFGDGEVTLRKNRRTDGFTVSIMETGYQGIEPGDLVIHGMDGFAGSIGISNSRGKSSPVLVVCDSEENKKYIMYYLRSMAYHDVFTALSAGVRVRSCDLRWNKLAELPYILPSIQEQEKIVDAIDSCTAKVDALIENVQAQIEKLKVYRQGLITEVITKGLDPAVPMRDSGVEWIGAIADTRTVLRLKYLLNSPMQYGANESGDKFSEGSVRHIRITDITADGKLKDDEKNQYLPISVAEQYILKDKDVLFARSGGTVGKSFLYHEDYGASSFARYLVKAECDKASLLPKYLIYYTQSSLYEIWKNMIFIQATIRNISANKYSNMEIPVPSVEEQASIIEYLDEKCSRVDRLIAIKQSKIKKLEQYKRSLIYEYVTGKNEVVPKGLSE